jgi:hypothetical protein
MKSDELFYMRFWRAQERLWKVSAFSHAQFFIWINPPFSDFNSRKDIASRNTYLTSPLCKAIQKD